MTPEEFEDMDNKDEVYRQYYDIMQSKYLQTLVCDEIIEEHKNKPLGQHSEALERLLHFFRCGPQKGKYAIKHDKQSNTYKVITLSGIRGVPPKIADDKEYTNIQDAYHGVFLRRLMDLMER